MKLFILLLLLALPISAGAAALTVTTNKELKVTLVQTGREIGQITLPEKSKLTVIREDGEDLVVDAYGGEARIKKKDCDYEEVYEPAGKPGPEHPAKSSSLPVVPTLSSTTATNAEKKEEPKTIVLSGYLFQYSEDGFLVSGRLYDQVVEKGKGTTFVPVLKTKYVPWDSVKTILLHDWPETKVAPNGPIECRVIYLGMKSFSDDFGGTIQSAEVKFYKYLDAAEEMDLHPGSVPKKAQQGPILH